MKPTGKICIYGGTFDMPHRGHLASYEWLRAQGHDVIVVPAIGHEFKPHTLSTYLYRKAMCHRTFGHPAVRGIEEAVLTIKPLPIMAIDVMREVHDIFGSAPLFAIGPDVDPDRWTGIELIRSEGYEFLRMPEVEHTPRSSVIRELIATGKPWDQHVTEGVAKFIRLHGLYGCKP
jgi:nicotinic acid mononucleotide adenylyltransferase